MKTSAATEAGAAALRKASLLSAMVIAAEGARADAALTSGFRVSSSSLAVSVERPGRCGGRFETSTPLACVPVGRPVPLVDARTISAAVTLYYAATAINPATFASVPVEVVPVIESVAPRVVPVVVVNDVSVMPIASPMMPAPSIASEPTNSEAGSEREVGAVKPDSGIRVPPRPLRDGISVNHPRIISRDVNVIGASRLNDDRRVLRGYGLLRCGLKITGLLCPLAHHLYCIHHILLLVVVGVS
jgi:hypothetical protein